MKIRIRWYTDSHECDTCGTSYAYGAKVYLADRLFMDYVPNAHCFGGDDHTLEDIYKDLLASLGYTIEEETENAS